MHPSDTPERLRLRKTDKLVLKAQFERLRSAGVKAAGPAIVAVRADAELFKCAVICGKKYSLLAVKRNRARRLLWESVRLLKPQILPCHLLLIPRRRLADYTGPEAAREVAGLLRKLGILKPAENVPVSRQEP